MMGGNGSDTWTLVQVHVARESEIELQKRFALSKTDMVRVQWWVDNTVIRLLGFFSLSSTSI